MDNQIKVYEFPIAQDQFLRVDKTDLIQKLFSDFEVKLAADDIKILKDGLQLQLSLGPNNSTIPASTIRGIADYFTCLGVEKVIFDDQVYKLWINASPEYLFVGPDDSKLKIAPAGVDAPSGTIQVQVEENKVYTLVYSHKDKINEAIQYALMMLDTNLSGHPIVNKSKNPIKRLTDKRILAIRENFGESGRIYNDVVDFNSFKVLSVIVHA